MPPVQGDVELGDMREGVAKLSEDAQLRLALGMYDLHSSHTIHEADPDTKVTSSLSS